MRSTPKQSLSVQDNINYEHNGQEAGVVTFMGSQRSLTHGHEQLN